ncbi:hypothetical protein K435DRAFT_879711 [Dendrothele bispora CBS 962.96]|uniref:Uncharacterized protein n=1 Tax=Dendrothele bispora (strain CBS 962.96) TaxID=1314807 RepID=A0A4S8KKU2_DENBC|nr:hypothetical protein K435DRAFT_879711 [Dendrothele bispora CBS 962.96]
MKQGRTKKVKYSKEIVEQSVISLIVAEVASFHGIDLPSSETPPYVTTVRPGETRDSRRVSTTKLQMRTTTTKKTMTTQRAVPTTKQGEVVAQVKPSTGIPTQRTTSTGIAAAPHKIEPGRQGRCSGKKILIIPNGGTGKRVNIRTKRIDTSIQNVHDEKPTAKRLRRQVQNV